MADNGEESETAGFDEWVKSTFSLEESESE